MLHRFFVEERGYKPEVLRTLILRYPVILSKDEEHIQTFFQLLADRGVAEEEAMKLLMECPRLISFDLKKQMKEIFFLFDLYNKIPEKDVIEIFRSFPYLFCCEIEKV